MSPIKSRPVCRMNHQSSVFSSDVKSSFLSVWLQYIESLHCVVVLLNIAWSHYWRTTQLFSSVPDTIDQDHRSLAEVGAVQWTFSTIANGTISLRIDRKCVIRRELLGKSETAYRLSTNALANASADRPAKLHLILLFYTRFLGLQDSADSVYISLCLNLFRNH